MKDDVVQYDREERIGIITVNRPQVRNALNMSVFTALDEVLNRVSKDEDVRALVITGAGTGFVAGADVSELVGHTIIGGWTINRYQKSVVTKLERIGKPSIAAIRGFCLGGGLELALSCTFRVASKKAKLGFPELGLGIIPGLGGTERAVRTVGYAKAAEMVLRHCIIDGQEAYRIGLINEAVESDDEVMGRAKEWAGDLARLNPVAVRMELELLLQEQGSTIDNGLAMESALGAIAVTSDEAKELLGKFLEKMK